MELEKLHKYLKGRLKKYDTFETLWVIYSYFQNAYYDRDFPANIKPHPAYIENKQIVLFPSKTIISLRESILYCWYRASAIEKWIMQPERFWDFWDTINNLTWEAYLLSSDEHDENRISFELYRLANQQFKWQSIFSNYEEYMNIYYYLFSDPDLEDIIHATIWLKAIEYYAIGYLFLWNFIDKFALKSDFSFIDESFRDVITKEKIDIFIERFSIDIDELKVKMKNKQKYDEWFEFYGIVDLLNFPLIRISKLWVGYYCSPVLPIFIKALSEWLYFRCLRNRTDGINWIFGSKYWLRFQKLCEINITWHLQNTSIKWWLDEELSRNDPQDDKWNDSDFYFTESNCLLFLEAKTKIIPESCYITAKDIDFINELNTWVDYLCQCYSTINRYLVWDFHHCIGRWIRNIYPVIITPNDLFFWFATDIGSIINRIDWMLIDAFGKNWLDPELITKYPYSFLTIQQLPLFITLIDRFTILKVMETFLQWKHRHYSISEMAREEFGLNEQFWVITEVNLWDEISRVVLWK